MTDLNNVYELTTIQDIFDKVPTERIQECCRELGLLLAQTKAMAGIAAPTDFSLVFTIEWTDDGLGDVTTSIECMDGEVVTLKTKLPQGGRHG